MRVPVDGGAGAVLVGVALAMQAARASPSAPDAGPPAEGLAAAVAALELRRDTASHSEMIGAITRTVQDGLRDDGSPSHATRGLASALRRVLGATPGILTADVDEDGVEDLVLFLPFGEEFATLAFRGGRGFEATELPAIDEQSQRDFLYTEERPPLLSTERLTGDGRTSIVESLCCGSGTGHSERLQAWRWNAALGVFDRIVDVDLSNWAGPSTWDLRPGPTGSRELVVRETAVGLFEHKLDSGHRTATQVWRWDRTRGRFAVAEERLSPPTIRRHVAALGEEALRRGDYAEAAAAFARVVSDGSLGDGDEERVDWIAFAELRLGLTQAMRGRREEARAALQRAAARDGSIGRLAGEVLAAYRGDVPAARAWAAVGAMANGDFRDATFEPLYLPYVAVAAYLDAAKPAPPVDTRALAAALDAIGIRVDPMFAGDPNGDGSEDVVFVAPPPAAGVYVLRRTNASWRPQKLIDLAPDVGIRAVARDTEGRRDVVVIAVPSMRPPLVGVAVDSGGTVLLYDVSDADGELRVTRRPQR